MTLTREDEALVEQAKAILSLNWTGEYTQPGPRLYPHQWSRDSAFVAIAYVHYNSGRAEKELRHLFEAQLSNGVLPQIVFNPRFRDYFPGPSFWNADESPNAPKRKEAKRGFVLLPRRWVVERDFAWASRFRRLVKDYERLPETVAGLHFVAFACLFLQQAADILVAGS